MRKLIISLMMLCLSLFFAARSSVNDPKAPETAMVSGHGEGFASATSSHSHVQAIRLLNYDLLSCQKCHGLEFDGGTTGESCLTCHTKSGGPENCSTCHGSTVNAAPPKTVAGLMADTLRVGAHQRHLVGNTFARTVPCSECHLVPFSVSSPGHLDAVTGATVTFNPNGVVSTASAVVPVPSYNFSAATCSNMHCHGHWKLRKSTSNFSWAYTDSVMTGANFSPRWDKGVSQTACGTTCHTNPPAGHNTLGLECSNCHGDVVDQNRKIIAPSKHVNGKINYGGIERPF